LGEHHALQGDGQHPVPIQCVENGGEKYPDLVRWQLHAERNTVEWIAEVETEESFSELDAHGRWQDYTALGMQFYLFVPKGCGAIAQSFALRAGVQINRIFEYSFEQDTFQLS
jgi:hypothetical protein